MSNKTEDSPVHYKLDEVADDLLAMDEMDLHITWETSCNPDEQGNIYNAGHIELNILLRQKVEKILKEKDGVCIHMKHERVSHSINYKHFTSVMHGEYLFTLYGKEK